MSILEEPASGDRQEDFGGRNLSGRIVGGGLWSAATALAAIPIGFLLTVVLARVLGPAEFGRFALYTFVLALAVGLSDLGLSETLVQRAAAALGAGDEDRALGACRAGLAWTLVRAPILCLLGFLVLRDVGAGFIFAIGSLISFLCTGSSYYLTATCNVRGLAKVRLFATLLSAIATLVTAVRTGNPALTFAVSSCALSVPAVLQFAYVPAVRRRMLLQPGRIALDKHDYRFSLAVYLNGQLGNFVFSRSEILFFLPSQAAARGAFSVAQTIAARCTIVVDALYASLGSGLSTVGMRGRGDLLAAWSRALRVTNLLIMLAAPTVFTLALVVVVPAFGAGYDGLIGPTAAMTAVSFLQTGCAPFIALRFAERAVGPLLAAGTVTTLLDVLMAATLVPRWGLAGATLANVCAGGVYVAIFGALLARDPEIRRRVATYIGRLVISVGGAACLALAGSAVPGGPVLRTLIAVPAALTLSVVLVRTLQPLHAGDAEWILDRTPHQLSLRGRPHIVGLVFGERRHQRYGPEL